ncbi:hypothetical protein RIR_jg30629.t2 [Rhizophagus irregularis DAOM 181602=DAOM 197198]|nr:hypothetical protein RIR_jg30629.t2 [Rhizophagus irregularis DAOM 181602=DAOM 197198]CAG8502108.1 13492_t:CDS:2 [Rhizophagus irregularis]
MPDVELIAFDNSNITTVIAGGSTAPSKTSDLIGALANGSSSRAGESAIIEKSIILDSDSCENTIQQVFKNR